MLETQENSEVVSLAGRMFPSTKNTVFLKQNLTDQILEINYETEHSRINTFKGFKWKELSSVNSKIDMQT